MGNPRGRSIGGMQSRTSTARKPAPRAADDVAEAQVIELVQPDSDDSDGKLRPLDEVLAELGGMDGGKVQVRRIDPRGGRAEFVGNYRPDDVSGGEASLLQQLQDDFGAGEYLIHVRDGSGFVANRRVKVAERKRPAADAGASTLAAAVDRMQSQFTQLLQAVVTRPQASEGETEEKVLARMKLMADIVRPQGGQSADAQALMETLARGIELGQQIAGGGSGGGDSTAVMVQSLKTFESLFRSIPPRAPVPRQVRPAAPVPAVPAATAEAVPQVAAPEADRVTAVRALLSVVLAGAERDGDPELYAELVADQLGDDGAAELLRQPDPVAMLVQFEPAAEAHREWLGELVKALRDVQEGSNDDAPGAQRVDGDPVRAGGGDSNPGADAGAGAQPGRGQ